MKRLFSLVLCLCLLTTCLSASALAESGEAADDIKPNAGYSFDFVLRLNPEALANSISEQAQGYADLLQSLRFHGTYAESPKYGTFELNASIIPVDSRGEPISFRICGTEEVFLVSSSLLGEQTIKFSNYSFLGFCSKMSEHLEIPLHYLALLFPYTWKFHLKIPIEDWEHMVEHSDRDGNISAEDVWFLSDCWKFRVIQNEPVNILIDALCRDSGMEESFRAMLAEIQDYIHKQVAKEQGISFRREGDQTIWHCASGDFFTETRNDQTVRLVLNLPRMSMGYLPVFYLEQDFGENSQTSYLRGQILGSDHIQEDLVSLEASLLNFPVSWPSDFHSLFNFNLTGGLMPNIGFSAYLTGEENGYGRIEIRKPTVNYEPGPVILTVEGFMNPLEGDAAIESFDPYNTENSLDLLIANDMTIRSFLPEIITPMLKGLVRFLVGIPTSACQAIMDDLTKLGLLDLLLED